jgi:hypothetical protein
MFYIRHVTLIAHTRTTNELTRSGSEYQQTNPSNVNECVTNQIKLLLLYEIRQRERVIQAANNTII